MGKVAVVNQVLPILMKVKNTIERTEWISVLTERAKIEDQALLNELKNAIKQDKTIINEPLQKGGILEQAKCRALFSSLDVFR